MILRKALTLELPHFEDAELYDKMTKARREASRRPLSLVKRSFALVQSLISLTSYAVILVEFSGWAVLVLSAASIPAFIAEARFAGDAFRLFSWRSPDARKQNYLEVVVAREDYAKEVKLLGIGPMLVDRYDAIFRKLYSEESALARRAGFWGYVLGLLGTGALYGAYGWIAWTAALGAITLGQMTMYLLVFKQGQGALSTLLKGIGGIYEDSLYLSTLYAFLEEPTRPARGGQVVGPMPGDGIRFEGVSFTYPGASEPAPAVDAPPRPEAFVGHNGPEDDAIKPLTRRMR